MEKIQSIEVKCKGAGELSISYLSRLQGDLKILTDDNYKKLKNQILTEGFNFPIAIWEDKETSKIYTIDGNQRVEALNRLKEEGYLIPQIPIVWVEAENINQAKRKLLGGASQYGEYNQKGAEDFISTIEGIDIEYLNQNLALSNIVYENISFEQNEDSKKVEVSAHEREIKNTGKELSEGDFQDFQHTCPKCGFQWD